MSWEERMSRRAEERRVESDTEIAAREWRAQRERWVQEYAARLTREEVLESREQYVPIACACIGGPYCCQVRWQAEERVLNDEE